MSWVKYGELYRPPLLCSGWNKVEFCSRACHSALTGLLHISRKSGESLLSRKLAVGGDASAHSRTSGATLLHHGNGAPENLPLWLQLEVTTRVLNLVPF